MDALLVVTLCLPLTLPYVQAEEQPMVPASIDIDDMLESLEDALLLPEEPLGEPAEGPEMELIAVGYYFAPFPYTEPIRGFEYQINQGISQCNRDIRLSNCSWKRGYLETASFQTFEQEISDEICCCACHRVDACEAIHYERRKGKCVFHQGPTLRRRRRRGTKRWSKP